jgi:hypothetical protein
LACGRRRPLIEGIDHLCVCSSLLHCRIFGRKAGFHFS